MKSNESSAARNHPLDRGFTLIELLVTLTVAGILASIGVPAFNTFVQNDRDVAQVNSLLYSLNYARSEAVKLNSSTFVSVCPSSDGATCNNGNSWATGWIVFAGPLNVAPAATLQAVPATSGSNTLTARGTGQAGVQFTSSGQLSPQGTTLEINICDPRGANFARDIEVNSTGRVATSQIAGQSVSRVALACP